MHSISDIQDTINFTDLFEPRQMYKLQTELNVELYDPRQNSFQERTLFVNVRDPVHSDNLNFVDELIDRYEHTISEIQDIEGSGLQLHALGSFTVTLMKLSLGGGRAVTIPDWINKRSIVCQT